MGKRGEKTWGQGYCFATQEMTKTISLSLCFMYPCSDELQGGMEMLTMTQIDFIRKMYYEQGKSISEISRITNYYNNARARWQVLVLSRAFRIFS